MKAKFFFDTEFIDGVVPQLISIGIVDDAGREYYAVSNEWSIADCNPWVRQHVLPKLPPPETWKSRQQIRDEIVAFVNARNAPPEFWGYFVAWDWILLCGLFGAMLCTPAGWPNLAYDVVQYATFLGKRWPLLPKPKDAHDALVDARWTKRMYEVLTSQDTLLAVAGVSKQPSRRSLTEQLASVVQYAQEAMDGPHNADALYSALSNIRHMAASED